MSEKSKFEQLAAINVADHIEKKNNLSYLSWAWAVDQLLRADPAAVWNYNDPVMFGQTMMVSCTVTAFGKQMTMQLPVMDYKNKAIANPDAFAVNTAMMRCLVKAIALHGLGLYIYAGEDLPLDDAQSSVEVKKPGVHKPTGDTLSSMDAEEQAYIRGLADQVIAMDAAAAVKFIESEKIDNDEKVALWELLPSNVRSAFKKASAEAKAL